MDYAVLKRVVEYGDVYELVAAGMTSVEELKTALNMTIRLLQRIF